MFISFAKMTPEGGPEGGGGAAAAPAVVAPAAPSAPAATPAPTSQASTPTVVAPASPAAPAAPSAEAAPTPDLATVLAELEAGRKKTAELEAALSKSNTDARKIAFDAAFDRAGVMPDQLDEKGQPKGPRYRDFLKSQLGEVDPRTDAGKAAIDSIVAQHPAMKSAHQSTEDPMAAFLRAKTAEASKAGGQSMWGLIPPDMMRGYDVKGGE